MKTRFTDQSYISPEEKMEVLKHKINQQSIEELAHRNYTIDSRDIPKDPTSNTTVDKITEVDIEQSMLIENQKEKKEVKRKSLN